MDAEEEDETQWRPAAKEYRYLVRGKGVTDPYCVRGIFVFTKKATTDELIRLAKRWPGTQNIQSLIVCTPDELLHLAGYRPWD